MSRRSLKMCNLSHQYVIPEMLHHLGQSRQYHLRRRIGRGRFTTVYEAELLSSISERRVVALKTQRKQHQIYSEIWIQADLHHPNVAELYGSFNLDRYTFHVLEFCSLGTLQDIVKTRGVLGRFEMSKLAIQFAGGIKYLHSKMVIHRDLKPPNIGLDAAMNLKILDFGLAFLKHSGDAFASEKCGTFGFMAPEVLGGEKYSYAVDIWSAGMVIYYMLTGSISPTVWAVEGSSAVNEQALDLLEAMWAENAADRPSPDEIVHHPFIFQASALSSQYCAAAGVGWQEARSDRPWPCVGADSCRAPIRSSRDGFCGDLGFSWAF